MGQLTTVDHTHTYTRGRGICLEIRRVIVGASGRYTRQFLGQMIQETVPGGLANGTMGPLAPTGNQGTVNLSSSSHTSSKEA